MHHHCRATAPPSSSPSRSPHARLLSDRVIMLTAPPRHRSTLQYTPSCLLTPSPTSARMLHRGAHRRQGSGDLLVTGSTPLHSPHRVGLAPLSGLPKTAPYHRCCRSPGAPCRRRARSARLRPFQPLWPPPLDARRRAASNAPGHSLEDPLGAKPTSLPSRAAAFGSPDSAPARLRPVSDVASTWHRLGH